MIFGRVFQKEQAWRRADSKKWRPWFAWFPIFLSDGRTAWLEVVERQRQYYQASWDRHYLLPEPVGERWLYRERV